MEPVEKTGRPDEVEIHKTRWVPAAKASKLLSYPSDLRLIVRYNGHRTAR